jgi:hypothetical protein
MGDETTTLGGIHISPNAVATIAYHATLESYGVVGLVNLCAVCLSAIPAKTLILISMSLLNTVHALTRWLKALGTRFASMLKKRLDCVLAPSMCM